MDRASRLVLAISPLLIVSGFILLGREFPGYFTNQQYLGGVIFLEILAICVAFYDRLFFPFLMIAFFWAGMNLPLSGAWTQARWVVLGVGSFFGLVRGMRLGLGGYKWFHTIALFCVGTAMVSAMVSALPKFSVLKVLSLFLLFLYGLSGARLVLRDPGRFFRGLLLACEIGVYLTAIAYLVLHLEIWGNTNSLGAVQGVVAAPILLWGAITAERQNLRWRRGIACLMAMYLVYFSVTRAALLGASISMLVTLLGLRRQKLILQALIGAGCVLALTIIVAPSHFEELKSSFTSGVIYKGHREEGLLGSRLSPWQETTQVIQENPYFGSGFGASLTEDKPSSESAFRSTSATNREHGNSYLAITEWVGLVGILPFLLLIVVLLRAIVRVFLWIRQTRSACSYAVPLMMVLLAGLVHAFFEDWLFAVGYYLTIFFWTCAFLFMDLVPKLEPAPAVMKPRMQLAYGPNPMARH